MARIFLKLLISIRGFIDYCGVSLDKVEYDSSKSKYLFTARILNKSSLKLFHSFIILGYFSEN